MAKLIPLIIVIAFLVNIAIAEPPRFRSGKFRQNNRFFQRQELEPTTPDASDVGATTEQPSGGPYPAAPYAASGYRPGRAFQLPDEARTEEPEPTTTEAPAGPYPPSGWKPAGVRLDLPTARAIQPVQTYGAPSQAYGPPSPSYGPPTSDGESGTTDEPETSAEEQTDEPDVENVDIQGNQAERFGLDAAGAQPGFYYVQLPDGNIGKVTYVSAVDQNQIVARIQVQPVQAQPQTILQAQPVLQAQPLVLNAPIIAAAPPSKAYSFSSQYQSW